MQGHVRTRPSAKFCRKQDNGTCQIRLTKCSHYVSFKGHWQTKKSPVGQCKWNNNKSSCYVTFCLSQYLFTAEVWVIAPPRIFNSFHDVPLEFKDFTHLQAFEFRGLRILRSSTVTLSLPLAYQHLIFIDAHEIITSTAMDEISQKYGIALRMLLLGRRKFVNVEQQSVGLPVSASPKVFKRGYIFQKHCCFHNLLADFLHRKCGRLCRLYKTLFKGALQNKVTRNFINQRTIVTQFEDQRTNNTTMKDWEEGVHVNH